MLVQRRPDSLRLVRQQDHARLAGAVAHAWRPAGPGGGSGLPFRLVWAVSVHDLAWRHLDAEPRLDPGRGIPYGFDRHPVGQKLEAYASGVDLLAELDPYAALLVSRHYASFVSGREEAEGYLRRERRRGSELRRLLPERLRADELLAEELAWLKAFDSLSLYACLTPPGIAPGTRPDWLLPGDEVKLPSGTPVRLEWRDESRLALRPCPLERPVEWPVPYREIPARRYPSPAALREAWSRAPRDHWTVRLEG